MKLDSIFKALNIETVEDIERLTGYFVEAKFENNNDDVELIHPNEVVKALRTFLEAWKEARPFYCIPYCKQILTLVPARFSSRG